MPLRFQQTMGGGAQDTTRLERRGSGKNGVRSKRPPMGNTVMCPDVLGLFAKQVAVSFLVPARPLCCLRSCLVGSGRGGLPLTRSRA